MSQTRYTKLLPRPVEPGDFIWVHSASFCNIPKGGIEGEVIPRAPAFFGTDQTVNLPQMVCMTGWRALRAPLGASSVETDAAAVYVGPHRPKGLLLTGYIDGAGRGSGDSILVGSPVAVLGSDGRCSVILGGGSAVGTLRLYDAAVFLQVNTITGSEVSSTSVGAPETLVSITLPAGGVYLVVFEPASDDFTMTFSIGAD